MSETFPDDVMFAAREAALEMCPWDEPDERAAWKAAKWPIIARAIMAERERCAQVIQDWRNKLDNRTEQAEGWAAEQLYYAVLGKEPDA
jgi:hypothetical protein